MDEQLVRAGGTDAVELIFNMVAALAMKANLAEESEQNQRYFDVLLVLIQFGSASVITVGTLGDKLKIAREWLAERIKRKVEHKGKQQEVSNRDGQVGEKNFL